ncbi:hypothetical protein J421_4661 (plasmid) [Gemmatirosa kalamazoonensis]|uniref:Uncharacterized protein n=1 Tax=Gemmatirosa kalamazoonensis TaxID=861299 RepID=W0RN81_9BACT|nr:hypothetical protein [Gemmatirosa kalamazoonensis]AHG92128.1 hypothetical protein J421_4593 [Gemmatirosa kalamazoonensis]AHG92196.1 hypothetical protein J421_4661 [Gemmatirosa kalamazoonensis]
MIAPRHTAALPAAEFVLAVEDLKRRTVDWSDALLQQFASECVELVIVGGKFGLPGTPVDTGFARNMWVVSLGAPPAGLGTAERPKDGTPEPIGPAALDEIASAIAGTHVGDIIWCGNRAVYIAALENGHSDQAPEGFVRLTLLQADRIFDDAVRATARVLEGGTPNARGGARA